jgi:hypothetical protein
VESAAISRRDDPARLLTNLHDGGNNCKLVENNTGESKAVAIAGRVWTLDLLLLEKLVRVHRLVEETLHC